MDTRTKIVLVLLTAIAVIVALIWVTSATSYSKDIPQQVVEWDTTIEPVAMLASADQRIASWKTQVTVSRHRQSSLACKTRQVVVTGRNAIGLWLVRGGQSIRWCRDGNRVVRVRVNRWGDTSSWALWSYEGVSSSVAGGARHYQYRRTHFHFRRGWGDVAQHLYPWASMTVRADLTCSYDKLEMSGQYNCT